MHASSLKRTILLAATLLTPAAMYAATPTTTTLTIIPNSNVVRSTAVTLQASVTANGSTVKQGQIVFCNANAAHCLDYNILGTAQITPAGTASFKRRFSVGNHAIKAVFQGTDQNQASTSATATIEVQGKDRTFTELSVSPDEKTYTARITSDGPVIPTGLVAFAHATDSAHPFATATPTSGSSPVFSTKVLPVIPSQHIPPQAMVTADLNGDGLLDIGWFDGEIFLAKGDGSFYAAPSLALPPPPKGQPPVTFGYVASADLNSDGIPDLAYSYLDTTAIFLGTGNGNFSFKSVLPEIPLKFLIEKGGIAISDFNRDGILDIAIGLFVYYPNITPPVTVFLGRGDGSFVKGWSAPSLTSAQGPPRLLAGDFNRDGRTDLLLYSSPPAATTTTQQLYTQIFLNNGDGTFAPQPGQLLGSPELFLYPQIVLADFNGDGIPDIASITTAHPSQFGGGPIELAVYPGKGDGSFDSAPILTDASYDNYVSFALGDFNADGKPDLLITYQKLPSSTPASVFFGKGDGTFQEADTPAQPFLYSIGTADFWGRGLTDVMSEQFDDLSVYVDYANPQTIAMATNTTEPSLPNHHIFASFLGDNSNQPSRSPDFLLYQYPVQSAVTLQIASDALGHVFFKAVVTPATAGQVNDDGHVSYFDGDTYLGNAYVLNGSTPPDSFEATLAPGTHDLAAVYRGNAYFKPSTSPHVTVTIP